MNIQTQQVRRISAGGRRRLGYLIRGLPDRRFEYPADMDGGFRELHTACAPFTMTSVDRMYALRQAVRYVVANRVAGDIVECGVWRGGSAMMAALTLQAEPDDGRLVWLYDTFEGMTEPGPLDVRRHDNFNASANWGEIAGDRTLDMFAYSSFDEVRANMTAAGVKQASLKYVVGRVEETIPSVVPSSISILRLDTDWYESTRHELEHLWPLLSPGGVLIVDDYGYFAGSQRAVDEFFEGREDAPFLNRVDVGRVAVKPFPRA
jgi:hypothetical protein